MIDNNTVNIQGKKDIPTLKVVHKRTGKFEVFFPFSDVPVEMTKQYFEKNIDVNQYVIDLVDDFDHPKAG